jgi:hypothetical protein
MTDSTVPSPSIKLDFHFEKSNFFRVIHVDGCWGGVTPRGTLHVGLFSERTATPSLTQVTVSPEGLPSPELVLESRQGLVREMEVAAIMDINVAVSFHLWMRDQLEQLRKGLRISDEQWSQMIGRGNQK